MKNILLTAPLKIIKIFERLAVVAISKYKETKKNCIL